MILLVACLRIFPIGSKTKLAHHFDLLSLAIYHVLASLKHFVKHLAFVASCSRRKSKKHWTVS